LAAAGGPGPGTAGTASMSALTAFEVQSYRNGDWRIETITDSKELAVHQAESIIMSPGVHKVRVVEEAFNPNSAEQKFRTVFIRHKQPPKTAAASPPQAAQPRAEEAAARAPADEAPQPAAAPPRARLSAIGLSLKFAAIVCAGIAVIIALRYFAASP